MSPSLLIALLQEPFFLRAALIGLGAAALAAPLGCLAIWHRMAFFGDALAHASLLGIALAVAANLPVAVGGGLAAVALAVALAVLSLKRILEADALLALLAHAALAFGALAVALAEAPPADLHAMLFGDVLAANAEDAILFALVAPLIAVAVAKLWKPMLALAVDPDVARAEGVAETPARIGFLVAVALLVAVAMKVVGLLLIAALLVIPAVAARFAAETPEHMAKRAAVIGCASVIAGLLAAGLFDLPSGAAIVAVAAVIFVVQALRAEKQARKSDDKTTT